MNSLPLELQNIVDQYGLVLSHPTRPIIKHYGMGDLLFLVILQRQGKIGPINFNLVYFNEKLCNYFDNCTNALEFRIRLLKELKANVNYTYIDNMKDNTYSFNQLVKVIDNYKLELDTPPQTIISEPYIVFHTKLRLGREIVNKNAIRQNVVNVLSHFKCKYKIVLLGEKEFKADRSILESDISTIYNELLCLRNNNDVLDLTIPSIHNQMNYESLLESISIIKGAECNISIGWGGSFCLSLMFGKRCLTYIDKINYHSILDRKNMENNNTYLFSDIETFRQTLYREYETNMSYKQITRDNISLLSKFTSSEISTHFRYFNHRDVKTCVEQHTYTVIGYNNDEAVSYGHLDYEGKYWLGICVLEEFRGKGYGKDMMKHLIDIAKKKNLPEINLTVDVDNIAAISLYKKLGFLEISRDKHITMILPMIKDNITLPVSYGEAFDKMSILDIKLNKITDHRRNDVETEYNMIKKNIFHLMNGNINYHYKTLYDSNQLIWDMQDQFRYENGGSELCDKIILENDRRFRIKSKINNLLRSELVEQKGYVKRKAFVLTHLGLGDMITSIGLIRYLATLYEEVKVVCKKSYQKNVELIYSDDNTITIYPVDNDINISPKFGFSNELFNTITKDYTTIMVGCHGAKKIYDIPFCFYDHACLNTKYFWDFFHIPDTQSSNTLYDSIKDREYIVIHNTNSKGNVFTAKSVEEHLG